MDVSLISIRNSLGSYDGIVTVTRSGTDMRLKDGSNDVSLSQLTSGGSSSGFSGYIGKAGGQSLHYTYDDTSIGSPPSSGAFRLNNAAIASVNSIFVHVEDFYGIDQTAFHQSYSSSAKLRLFDKDDPSTFALFTITGNAVGMTVATYAVIYVSHNGTLGTGSGGVVATFSLNGSSGFSGFSGYTGTSGFSGYSGDTGAGGQQEPLVFLATLEPQAFRDTLANLGFLVTAEPMAQAAHRVSAVTAETPHLVSLGIAALLGFQAIREPLVFLATLAPQAFRDTLEPQASLATAAPLVSADIAALQASPVIPENLDTPVFQDFQDTVEPPQASLDTPVFLVFQDTLVFQAFQGIQAGLDFRVIQAPPPRTSG